MIFLIIFFAHFLNLKFHQRSLTLNPCNTISHCYVFFFIKTRSFYTFNVTKQFHVPYLRSRADEVEKNNNLFIHLRVYFYFYFYNRKCNIPTSHPFIPFSSFFRNATHTDIHYIIVLVKYKNQLPNNTRMYTHKHTHYFLKLIAKRCRIFLIFHLLESIKFYYTFSFFFFFKIFQFSFSLNATSSIMLFISNLYYFRFGLQSL